MSERGRNLLISLNHRINSKGYLSLADADVSQVVEATLRDEAREAVEWERTRVKSLMDAVSEFEAYQSEAGDSFGGVRRREKVFAAFHALRYGFQRASGLMTCDACKKDYYHHPLATEQEHLGYMGDPFLNRLCNGALVKL